MHVYMYMYTCTCICTRICTSIELCSMYYVSTYMCVFLHLRLYLYMYCITHVYVYACECVHRHIYSFVILWISHIQMVTRNQSKLECKRIRMQFKWICILKLECKRIRMQFKWIKRYNPLCFLPISSDFEPVEVPYTMNMRNEPLHVMACVVKRGTPPNRSGNFAAVSFKHKKRPFSPGANLVLWRGSVTGWGARLQQKSSLNKVFFGSRSVRKSQLAFFGRFSQHLESERKSSRGGLICGT